MSISSFYSDYVHHLPEILRVEIARVLVFPSSLICHNFCVNLTFFQTLAYFLARFQDINRCFILQMLLKKVDNINRAICFACCCISSSQFKSEVQLFRFRMTENIIFILPKQPRFESIIPSIKYTIESMVQSTLALWTPRYNGHPDNTDSR